MPSTQNSKKTKSESSRHVKPQMMKSNRMVWVDHQPGDPPIDDGTDWDRVNAMTNEEVLAAALSDPDAQPIPAGTEEELERIGLKRVVNPKRLRDRLRLTQGEFAARYRIPIGTLRDWEQGRKLPDATARAYLTVIDRDPNAVATLLGEAAA